MVAWKAKTGHRGRMVNIPCAREGCRGRSTDWKDVINPAFKKAKPQAPTPAGTPGVLTKKPAGPSSNHTNLSAQRKATQAKNLDLFDPYAKKTLAADSGGWAMDDGEEKKASRAFWGERCSFLICRSWLVAFSVDPAVPGCSGSVSLSVVDVSSFHRMPAEEEEDQGGQGRLGLQLGRVRDSSSRPS